MAAATDICFLLGGAPRRLNAVDPCRTVLDYLRRTEHLTGTKEGCAEGDCGACTVLLGEAVDDRVRYRAVNACILPMPALHGKQLLTVEHLRGPAGEPHPVQQAMVEHHASQCGFCTPGFVMSVAAMQRDGTPPDPAAVADALAGNLCRCTGYRPIVAAALAALNEPRPSPPAMPDRLADTLRDLAGTADLHVQAAGRVLYAPRSLDALAARCLECPDAVLLAGGTDIGLWITKQHRALPALIALDGVAALRAIAEGDGWLRIGAAACYTDAVPFLVRHWPGLATLLRRLGARQVRNRGTIGGNVANASPVGDMPPVLLALDAVLVLRRGAVQRRVPIAEFFLEPAATDDDQHRPSLDRTRTALAAGEFIERIDLPLPSPDQHLFVAKLAKRFDQDVSSLLLALRVDRDGGAITRARVAFGGMAAIPKRAVAAEAALCAGGWTEPAFLRAGAAVQADFSPISDWRGTAAYRRVAARNLLHKAWLEIGP